MVKKISINYKVFLFVFLISISLSIIIAATPMEFGHSSDEILVMINSIQKSLQDSINDNTIIPKGDNGDPGTNGANGANGADGLARPTNNCGGFSPGFKCTVGSSCGNSNFPYSVRVCQSNGQWQRFNGVPCSSQYSACPF